MSARLKPIPELNREVFRILSRELGVADTLRFFAQLWAGAGDYTKERRDLFARLTLEEYRHGLDQLQAEE